MANYWGRQRSSRSLITSTTTSLAIKAGSETYQLRATTTVAASLAICDTSSTSTAVSGVVLVPISANVPGEYFTISPGQWYLVGPAMFVSEMT